MEKKTVAVLGMMCAGCAANVEKKLNSLTGINSATVNLPARTALIEYNPQEITLAQMKDVLAAAGYDMVTEEDRDIEEIERKQYLSLKRKTGLSWGFALITMAISMKWINIENITAANIAMLAIALVNIIYCGRMFYASAWKQLTNASANMDTLVAMSTAISFLFSVFNTFWGDTTWGIRNIEYHTYYDASVMIITFILTGRVLEERAKNSTASAIKGLMGLAPKTARLINHTDNSITETPITALQPDDIIEIRPGDKIPVDGTITEGTAYVDESMISGEPEPVVKEKGSKLLAGTIVKEGTARFKAEKVGSETVLANIIRMVRQAQGSKAPVQRITDKIAMIFVPAIVLISLATLVLWIVIGGTDMLPHAILSAVSVLVIACPCAMGLATPTALMVGIGKAAQKNILIKDATALENLKNVNAVVTDKTGTVTQLVRKTGTTAIEEQLKPHAREAMEQLQNAGIDIYMMSGDKEDNVRRWAEKAGIKHYQSKVMPQDKENLVRKLQAEGKCVAMIGDGINDSQALAAANVSIAMGKGTDIAMDVAQVTLMSNDLRRISEAIVLSGKTVGMIRQNLFWAFIYNVTCIPIAAGALYGVAGFQISPMWASALMAMSSVSVVLNSLRLKLT
ncbi:heavy metal translocating P-type ATPase [Xylanibacter muris]|uniref:Heavy metal translocating P-type ATPase n=1 Tax=Xylanibacter muris TaxID=2736290 RepID=A0ABX2ARD3_9BACT|nr:heavy metal translocating P-type ATPase [Xylanibacter muris]NPD92785.1 heavy metal translocating P-type ATPase [Xylanibacter muris]